MKPHHWPLVALGVSAAAAITIVVVVGSRSPAVNMPVLIGIPLVATYLAHLLSKRAPGKVLFEFRVDPRPSWYNDAVEVTDSGLEITASSGGGRRASRGPTRLSYGFNDLLGISTRQAVPGEAPWITLSDGRGLPVPPGEVVVLRTTSGEQVLPVESPQKFTALVRSRVSGLPEVHSTPAMRTDSQLDEVGDAPSPTGELTTPVEGPVVSLTGPPLAVRWLVGAVLALTGTVVLPLVALLTTPGVPWLVLTAPGVAGVVWVLNRNVPRVWGRVAFLAVPVSVFWLIGKGGYLWVPVLLVLCPLLGHLGGRMFRLGANLGRNVEVRVPLLSGASLYVQRDRLVHKPAWSKAAGVPAQAMWLGDVTLVQQGSMPKVLPWPAPNGDTIAVGASPLLRLVARPQQWILPVAEAGELAELIRSRQGMPAMPTRMSADEWRVLRQWAVRRSVGMGRAFFARPGIAWRLTAAAFTGQFIWMFVPLGAAVWVGGLISVTLTAGLLADWWRVRGRMLLAEHNLLPPGSRDWGEVRPDHAPLPGWQPYR
ncbi:hypothetical protein [Lentzea sp. NPDC060358]|uniref:hypothetical protein n=1 Tax=Lentzea sp. NPDC060358 TaxID=3347103 RepID=UPI00366464C7